VTGKCPQKNAGATVFQARRTRHGILAAGKKL